MRRIHASVLVAVIFVCALSAPPAYAVDPDFPTVSPGTEFPVEVERSISTAKSSPGDTVQFRTLHPILIGRNFVVPAGAALIGKIIDVRQANRSEDSFLRFSIHLIKWGKNSSATVNAVVSGRLRKKAYVRGDVRVVVPTYLDGVRIAYEPSAAATTFLTGQGRIELRRGTLLSIKHIVPNRQTSADMLPHSGE